jgi:hypothetical protein
MCRLNMSGNKHSYKRNGEKRSFHKKSFHKVKYHGSDSYKDRSGPRLKELKERRDLSHKDAMEEKLKMEPLKDLQANTLAKFLEEWEDRDEELRAFRFKNEAERINATSLLNYIPTELKLTLALSQMQRTLTRAVCQKEEIDFDAIPKEESQIGLLTNDLVKLYMEVKIKENGIVRGTRTKEALKTEVIMNQIRIDSEKGTIADQMDQYLTSITVLIRKKGLTIEEKEKVLLMIAGFKDKLLLFHVLKYIHRDTYQLTDTRMNLKIREKNTVEDRLVVKRDLLLNNAVAWNNEVIKVLSKVGQLVMDFYGDKCPLFSYLQEIDKTEKIKISPEDEVLLGKEYTNALKARDEPLKDKDLRNIKKTVEGRHNLRVKTAVIDEEGSSENSEEDGDSTHDSHGSTKSSLGEETEIESTEEEGDVYVRRIWNQERRKHTNATVCFNCHQKGCYSSRCTKDCRFCISAKEKDVKPASFKGCNAYTCKHNPDRPERKEKHKDNADRVKVKRVKDLFEEHKESDTVIDIKRLDLTKLDKNISKVKVLVGTSTEGNDASIMEVERHKKHKRDADDAILDSGADMVIAGEELWNKVKNMFKEVKMKTLERTITAVMANDTIEECDQYFTVPLLSLLLPSGKLLKMKDVDVLYMSHLTEVIIGNSVLFGVFRISLVDILDRLDSDLVYTFKRMHIEDGETGKVKERRLIQQFAGEE